MIFIGLVVVLYTIAYIYVATNRQKIIKRVVAEVNEKLNGTIAIGNVDVSFFSNFPQAAVVLKDVSIRDSLFHVHKHSFFEAKQFFAHFSMLNLVLGRDPLNGLRIKNAKMYVYTDTSGYTTSYLFTPRKKIADTPDQDKKGNVLKLVELENFRFIVDNRQKQKLYDISVKTADCDIETTDREVILDIEKSSHINTLAFNERKGSFVKNTSFESDFQLVFQKETRQISFKNIELLLNEHPFNFTGNFSLLGERNYELKVSTKKVNYEFAKRLLTEKIAKAISIVKVEKPLDVQAQIKGVLAPGEPLVNVQWQTKANNVQSIFFDVTNANFTGRYTNEVVRGLARNDANSAIDINNFVASWEGLQVKSKKANINNLLQPVLKCDLRSSFTLKALNRLLESRSFQLNGGSGDLNITYNGPLVENSSRNTFINGSLNFSDGNVLYKPRSIAMEDCDGSIIFKNTDVLVNGFNCRIQGNQLMMNGSAKNLMSLIATNPGKIGLDWHVRSPSLNLGSFVPLLKKRQKVEVVYAPSQGKLRKVANQVDNMLNEANVKLNLNAGKVVYKKFEATQVHAAVDMVKEDWLLNDVSFNHANGSMKLKGQLKELSERYYAAALNVDMKDVDVHKVLYSFNNFGQDALQSDNIRGKLSTNIVVAMNMDRQLASDPTELGGFIDFSLKNGELINFEPIQKLQVFLFKNRNFDQVKFAELKNRIEVKGKEFHIDRMEVQSTALTLFLSGVYSLDGNTDLSIQVPLSNLKKRGENYKPENIGADAKAGPSIFVRGTPGDDGNIRFKLDVFNKIRKRLKGDSK